LQQTLARLVIAARRQGLNDHDWAIAAGIRPETLSRLRQRQDCDLATLVKIARAAQCTLTLDAHMQGESMVSKDGLFPAKLSLREERAIASLACREASYQRSLDKARAAWLAMGPGYFMAGVALLASRALPHGRVRLVELATALHPGITVAKVFAHWRAHTPVPAENLLHAILEQSRSPQAAAPEQKLVLEAAAAEQSMSVPAKAGGAAPIGFESEKEAARFMAGFVAKLQRQGWTVTTEVPQSYTNDRGRLVEGRIDVVAEKAQRVIAYELDRAGAREKSIVKLRAFGRADEAYVICRNGRALRVGRAGDPSRRRRARAVVDAIAGGRPVAKQAIAKGARRRARK
jgi:hypothetical protein